ncbi:EpsG family protein [Leuconostoc mesenteroides]|uniref:EpsG family protein n=1 Tax=Leuconostoc mesenteroides TaxID=1245 RepID=UPI0032DE776B
MVIYISAILISLTLIWITNTVFTKKKYFGYYLFSVVSLLPTTIVAGIRDLTVGTDIRHYITPNFNAAQNYYNLFDYVSYVNSIKTAYVDTVNHTEMGYSVLVYLVAKLSSNPMWLLFTLQAITIVSIYIGLNIFHEENNRISVTFGMVVYYTLFFGPSLNIMRQTLAASLVFLSIALLCKKSYISSFVTVLIALQFHLSSLTGLVIFVVYFCIERFKKNKITLNFPSSVYMIILFIIVLVTGPVVFKGLQYIVTQISFLQKYASSLDYTGGYTISGTVLFVISDLIIFMIINVVEKIQKSNIIDKDDHLSYLFFITTLFSVFFFGIYSFQNVVPRLGIFFSIFRIASYSYYISKIKALDLRIICNVGITMLLFIIFFKVTLSGSGEIFPYTSEIWDNFINTII